jgi:hypothetical protein
MTQATTKRPTKMMTTRATMTMRATMAMTMTTGKKKARQWQRRLLPPSVGTLNNGYVGNVPLPQIPQIQSASHESIAQKEGIPLLCHLHLPSWIPTLTKPGSMLGFSQRLL